MAAVNVRGLDHVVLRVNDVERSIAWYKRVLGCTDRAVLAVP